MDIWGGNYLQCKDGMMTTDKMWMLWFIKANGSVDVLKNKCKINIQERSKCLHSLCFLFFFYWTDMWLMLYFVQFQEYCLFDFLFYFLFFDLPAGSADLLQKDFRVVSFVTLVFSLHVFMSNFYSVINELCHWPVHSFIEFVPGVKKQKQRSIGSSGRSRCLICIVALSGDSEVSADRRVNWSYDLKCMDSNSWEYIWCKRFNPASLSWRHGTHEG